MGDKRKDRNTLSQKDGKISVLCKLQAILNFTPTVQTKISKQGA